MKQTIQSLTPRQIEILKLVAEFQAHRCYSPTIGELAREMGISRTTAFEHISELRKKDLLLTSTGKARCLTLTPRASGLLDDTDKSSFERAPAHDGITLAGSVAAGLPIEAVEDRNDLSLPSLFGTGDNLFALEVRGDSMIEDGINDGDYVICRRSSTANNGQLVVALVDNEKATLKRFFKEKTCIRLQPANSSYQPIYSDNCKIEAVVIGLMRRL